MIKLPTFKGYTVDERLREFRKIEMNGKSPEWVPFDECQRQELLTEYALTFAKMRVTCETSALRTFRPG